MVLPKPTLLTLALLHFFPLTLAQQNATYDYIIIGSGPGGAPLASSLAHANHTVLLLEAGDLSPFSEGSAADMDSYPSTITWDFFVKHYEDEERNLMNHKVVWRTKEGGYWVGKGESGGPEGGELLGIYYPRGATVGGSSGINAMCTWLPADSDWNYIQNLTGDSSWSATNMRSIFERIEKNHYLPEGTPGHGFDGYFETTMLNTTTLSQPALGIAQAIASNLSIATTESAIAAEMNRDANLFSEKRDWMNGLFGLPRHQFADGSRYSSRDRVLDTIAKGYPLTLHTRSLATRVLFSEMSCGGTPRAIGVEYREGASLYKADARYTSENQGVLKKMYARKEIVISGGTFNTPQLLMLSGIGPKEQLQKFNISVVRDAPGVGNNMQDNQEMPIIGRFDPAVTGNGTFVQPIMMTTTPHTPDGERDMFLMQGSFTFRGFWPGNQSNTNLETDGPGTYGISMVKNHPQNRKGYVRLRSADPTDTPDINFMLYEEGKETDMGAMKDVVAWARKMYASARGVNVTAVEPPCPEGPDAEGYCGKADEDWITGQTFGHHPTSTAAIGKDGDVNAVLDSRFRVRGVKGLRVVDASVFPKIPGVFPVVSTFMISEKAGDVLKEDANKDICSA